MDCSPPGSSVHAICKARILEWVAIFLLQGKFPAQGLNSHLLHCRQILYREIQGRKISAKKTHLKSGLPLVSSLGRKGAEPVAVFRQYKQLTRIEHLLFARCPGDALWTAPLSTAGRRV